MVKYFRYLQPINEQMREAWLVSDQANGESLQVLTCYQRAIARGFVSNRSSQQKTF
jgi:hypothetical protein